MSGWTKNDVAVTPYTDPTPLPASIPTVQEVGVTSAPLKSAAFFIGAYCKDYNGTWSRLTYNSQLLTIPFSLLHTLILAGPLRKCCLPNDPWERRIQRTSCSAKLRTDDQNTVLKKVAKSRAAQQNCMSKNASLEAIQSE